MTPFLKRIRQLFVVVTLVVSAISMHGELVVSEPQPATITGTVTDLNGGAIPGATITAVGASVDKRHEVIADGSGVLSLSELAPSGAYRVAVHADGVAEWSSADITLSPGQQFEVTEIKLSLKAVETTVNAIFVDQLALEQVKPKRSNFLGIIPNFYVVYDPNVGPLTRKLKFQLAFRSATDVASFAAAGSLPASIKLRIRLITCREPRDLTSASVPRMRTAPQIS